MKAASEGIGEAAARQVMQEKYPDFSEISSQLPGNGKQGQFDMVYYNEKTGEVIIPEAKGGNSSAGSRIADDGRRVEQGTPEYRDSIIKNMENKIETAQNSDAYHNDSSYRQQIDALASSIDKLKDATTNKTIKTVVIKQPLNKDGSISATTKVSEMSNQYTETSP